MNARERAVLDALLPSAAAPGLPGLLETDVEGFLASFRAEASPGMRVGLSAALWAAVWVAPLLVFRAPPISRLSPDDRERALEALVSSRVYALRQLGLVLKAVVCFAYGAHP